MADPAATHAIAFTDNVYTDAPRTNADATVFHSRGVYALRESKPKWLPITIDKLRSLAGLEENWDSYGAVPVDLRSIERAAELIEYLGMFVNVDEPAVGATPDGEAGLSWDGGSWSLDVDVTPDGRYEYVFIDEQDSSAEIENATHNPADLLQYLPAWD